MKAILIDDEPLALDYLELQLNKVSNISIVGKFDSFNLEEHKELVQQINIAFLDMRMPNLHGIDLAVDLLKINPSLLVIFVTAYNDFATEAYEVSAFDYLVKPIQLNRLRKTCDRIEATLSVKSSIPKIEENLRICVGGELLFQTNNSVVRPDWRTLKVKELFLYLLHERGRSVLKSELAELLWPDVHPETSYSRLYTLIYNIRKTLSPYKDHLTIETTDEGYALHLINTSIDLFEWERQLNLFETLHPENILSFEKVMELYSGPYLGKYNYIWAETECYRLEQLYISKCFQIAKYYTQLGHHQQAVKWHTKIFNLQPYYEDAVYLLLKSLDKIGNYPLVPYYYEQFEKEIMDLQIDIGKEIKEWYTNWKRQHLKG